MFIRAKILTCENKAKNAFQEGEFSKRFREHDVLEQFLRILGFEIEEEKILVYFTVYRRIVLLALLKDTAL